MKKSNSKLIIYAAVFTWLIASQALNAKTTGASVSLLAQQIVKDLAVQNEIFVLNQIEQSDLFENAFLPVDQQIRPQSLIFESLSISSRKQIKHMVSNVLSTKGYMKLLTNLSIDNELTAKTANSTQHIIKFYGDPVTGKWGFKLEGYHLSLSFLISDDAFVFINYFIGQDLNLLDKTEYLADPIYNSEAHLGSALMNDLSARQMGKTYLSLNTPNDIITNPKQSVRITEQWGLPSKSLKKKQMPLFCQWVLESINVINFELLTQIHDNLDDNDFEDFHLAWSGHIDTTNNNFYYLIYNHQMTIEHSVNYNHIHSMVRITF